MLTRDAVPVCRHEPNLAQTTGKEPGRACSVYLGFIPGAKPQNHALQVCHAGLSIVTHLLHTFPPADALSKFGNRLRTYPFDGNQVEGIFTADLSAAELGMLKSKHPPPLADDPRYVEPSWGAPEDMRVRVCMCEHV